MNEIADSDIGNFQKIDDAWEASWSWSDDHVIGVTITFDEDPNELPQDLRDSLILLKKRDSEMRNKIADSMLDNYNDNWSEGNQVEREEFANRIKLEGILCYYPSDLEVFYSDDDLFAGHDIAARIDFDGKISEPYLAG